MLRVSGNPGDGSSNQSIIIMEQGNIQVKENANRMYGCLNSACDSCDCLGFNSKFPVLFRVLVVVIFTLSKKGKKPLRHRTRTEESLLPLFLHSN